MRTQLQFDERQHVYAVGGQRWPSVTQALDPITQFEFVDRDILARAAELGQHVHKAVHFLDLGLLDEATLDVNLVGYVSAYKSFMADTGARILASEHMVLHERLKYAGTLDKVISIKGAVRVVDIKTSLAVPRTVWPQTAAYLEALLDEAEHNSACLAAQLSLSRRTPRACLVLDAAGTYKLRLASPATMAFDLNMFVSCLNVHRWRLAA